MFSSFSPLTSRSSANRSSARQLPVSAGRWIVANMAGVALAMATFGVVADSPIVPEGAVIGPVGHLVGFLAFAAVLAAVQRRALGIARTRYRTWVLAQGVSVWLAYGLAYVAMGPPADFALGLVVLGISTGCLLRAEARAEGIAQVAGVAGRRLPVRGALAGLAAVPAMFPVVFVAEPIDDLLGGGFPPFLVIVALIGAAGGAAMGAVLRPVTTPQGSPVEETVAAMREVAPAPRPVAAPVRAVVGR